MNIKELILKVFSSLISSCDLTKDSTSFLLKVEEEVFLKIYTFSKINNQFKLSIGSIISLNFHFVSICKRGNGIFNG